MAFAVTLLFDADIAAAIAARWDLLAAEGISRSMLDLGYPPHVTLAVYDELDVEAAVVSLDRAFGGVAQAPVSLTGFATFGAGSGVCYAALEASPELDALHATIMDAMGRPCRPHYQRGHWTPHCTLAVRMADAEMDRARGVLGPDWRAIAGVFEAAELVEFEPVVSIRRWTLSAPRQIRTP
jgi:2'-5' RNA ligase